MKAIEVLIFNTQASNAQLKEVQETVEQLREDLAETEGKLDAQRVSAFPLGHEQGMLGTLCYQLHF